MKKQFLKKRNRSNNSKNLQHFKKNKKFGIKYSNNPQVNEDIMFTGDGAEYPSSNADNETTKLGKYWEGQNLIEPKNTFGTLGIFESDQNIFSIVDEKLHILDINDLSIKKVIKQVINIFSHLIHYRMTKQLYHTPLTLLKTR
jgi:hypothetical protein